MSTPLDLSPYSPTRPKIEKVKYTHDAMIDLIIQNPWISQNEIAKAFGYTPAWISTVFASDAFQERLAERKTEIVDPSIRATVEERFRALVIQSLDVLAKKLEAPLSSISDELALGALNGAAKALGYGARRDVLQINQQVVVHVPSKAASSAAWEEQYAKRAPQAPLIAQQPFEPPLEVEIVTELRSAPGALSADALLSELEGT